MISVIVSVDIQQRAVYHLSLRVPVQLQQQLATLFPIGKLVKDERF
jgi:hypothetical protein